MTDFLFRGTAPALVTPFTDDDRIDEYALRRLVDRQIDGGVEALVVLGTTGENATIWPAERHRIVDIVLEHTNGRVPVIIGTGNNSTSESIVFSKEAATQGADGLLVVGPYYNKPTQNGFFAHVAAIADATDCPIIIYNVPGRTSFNITSETSLRLAEEIPTVVGVKEASGDLGQISNILAHRPDHLAVYAGDDEFALPLICLGADGVVSVISNVLPDLFSEMIRTGLAGDFDEARELHFRLLPAMRACFFETNPIPVKMMLAEMGQIEPHLRLPLVPMEDANRQRTIDAFAGLVEEKVAG
ncbi:MAG TPA: 4-hydroxy-tetrahydrodipicolinate synthase [Rhodothermales bacterium]|nr:4-hydroxy-tetrahydrodipicolinate synthase [Rhodothermales bacterium]